ncbi:MAG: TetR/AcrR family transcriptional regulator [Bdellovibrionota bacterium]
MKKVRALPTTRKSSTSKDYIIRRAIECFAKKGYEASTFDYIAKQGGISRPLITHYFPKKEVLLLACVKNVSESAARLVEERMIKCQPHPWELLKCYIAANFEWAEKEPFQLRFWVIFCFYCAWITEYRRINQQLKYNARERILRLLLSGQSLKLFKFQGDPVLFSRTLHDTLYARILGIVTEGETPDFVKARREMEEIYAKLLGLNLGSVTNRI